MTYKNPLIAVADMQKSLDFYHRVLGLTVEQDFGTNQVLTGGVSLQTLESWAGFLGCDERDIRFGGKSAELYFEETDFDAFAARLAAMEDISYVHPVIEHRWGQRAVRIYDPDRHIIEVGEPMPAVARRFAGQGMDVEQIARRMDVGADFAAQLLAE